MSKSSILFTIEQWELIRRLRNSGLNKEHLCQAYDDLERIERELGSVYDVHNDVTNVNNSQQHTNANLTADPLTHSKNLQNFQVLMAKNLAAMNYYQGLLATTATLSPNHCSPTSSGQLNSSLNGHSRNTLSPSNENSNNSPILNVNTLLANSEIEDEARELEEFRL